MLTIIFILGLAVFVVGLVMVPEYEYKWVVLPVVGVAIMLFSCGMATINELNENLIR